MRLATEEIRAKRKQNTLKKRRFLGDFTTFVLFGPSLEAPLFGSCGFQVIAKFSPKLNGPGR